MLHLPSNVVPLVRIAMIWVAQILIQRAIPVTILIEIYDSFPLKSPGEITVDWKEESHHASEQPYFFTESKILLDVDF